MPIYVYVCDVCGEEHEEIIRIPLVPSCMVCPKGCGGKAVKREINKTSFQFKGRHGYRTEAFQKTEG